MARKTGFNRETMNRIIMDSGVVYLNYGSTDPLKPKRKLGATRGGNEFHLSGEVHDIGIDGLTGIVIGGRRFLGVTAELTINLIEVSKEILTMAVPGADATQLDSAKNEAGEIITGENMFEVKRRLEQTIPDIEYHNIAIVAEVSHLKTPVVCGLKNAINNGSLDLSFSDGDESVLAITFTGAIDPNDPDEEPWFILWPEKAVS